VLFKKGGIEGGAAKLKAAAPASHPREATSPKGQGGALVPSATPQAPCHVSVAESAGLIADLSFTSTSSAPAGMLLHPGRPNSGDMLSSVSGTCPRAGNRAQPGTGCRQFRQLDSLQESREKKAAATTAAAAAVGFLRLFSELSNAHRQQPPRAPPLPSPLGGPLLGKEWDSE